MAAKKKTRLDVALVEQGLVDNRSEARAAVMAGLVTVNGMPVDKPGRQVDSESKLALKAPARKYVSRGGDKIAGAHEVFQFDIKDKIALDGGASTGGFSDFLLKHGAKKIFAVDVGYGQLAWSLRQDERVVVLERTNIRNLTPEMLQGEKPTLVVLDLAFISLCKIWPAIELCCAEQCEVIALVKPQFEAGPGRVGKGGIVRDQKIHEDIVTEVINEAARTSLVPVDFTYSPIKGPKGNIEFFLHLCRSFDRPQISADKAAKVVAEAHQQLGGKK